MKSKIPVSEITKRHPDMLYCLTDREYANLANEICDVLGSRLGFMDDKGLRNACVSLALYFEDIHSGTHQFDVFTRLYGKMYGMYLPFYDSKDASSPNADIDAMKFVLWLSIVAERGGSIYGYRAFHDYQGQYEELVKRNGGKRLFFFNNQKDVEKWLSTKIGIAQLASFPIAQFSMSEAFMAFLHPNGQMLFVGGAKCVKSPDNPYYDKGEAEEGAMTLCLQPEGSHPDLVLYLIEHDLVPDAMLKDMKGKEHGRLLLQDNLDFMARCMRRDVESDKVVRRRHEISLTDENSNDDSQKVNFDTFVGILSKEKTVRSKANKAWRLVRCNKTTTVIRDVDNRRDFTMPTINLYTAYIEIDKEKIQVSTVARYVGSTNAPAASALLYNTVGKGIHWNEFHKSMDKLERLMKQSLKCYI